MIPRLVAHWVHTVTHPRANTVSSRSESGADPASSNAAARPGMPNQAASPVSHSEMPMPAAAAVAATVNPWEQRSASSCPAVTLTNNRLGTVSVMSDRLPHMVEIVYTGLLVGALALAGWVSFIVVYRLFKGQG